MQPGDELDLTCTLASGKQERVHYNAVATETITWSLNHITKWDPALAPDFVRIKIRGGFVYRTVVERNGSYTHLRVLIIPGEG